MHIQNQGIYILKQLRIFQIKINFNINENEEENSEIYSEEDVPLKVSQLKTEKGNYIVNNGINKNKEKNNYDEEKENECEIDNETRTNSEARDTYNLR